MVKVKKYAYCKTCQKSISKPERKKMESIYFTLWFIAILATAGLASIALVIYHFSKKRKYCPKCKKMIEFYDAPEQFPGTAPPVMFVLDKIEAEKENKKIKLENETKASIKQLADSVEKEIPEDVKTKKKTYCPYCNKRIDIDTIVCPYCHTSLE